MQALQSRKKLVLKALIVAEPRSFGQSGGTSAVWTSPILSKAVRSRPAGVAGQSVETGPGIFRFSDISPVFGIGRGGRGEIEPEIPEFRIGFRHGVDQPEFLSGPVNRPLEI